MRARTPHMRALARGQRWGLVAGTVVTPASQMAIIIPGAGSGRFGEPGFVYKWETGETLIPGQPKIIPSLGRCDADLG